MVNTTEIVEMKSEEKQLCLLDTMHIECSTKWKKIVGINMLWSQWKSGNRAKQTCNDYDTDYSGKTIFLTIKKINLFYT